MAVLVLSELLMYIKVDTTSHMAVADVHEHDVVAARLHATFPFVECKGEVTPSVGMRRTHVMFW